MFFFPEAADYSREFSWASAANLGLESLQSLLVLI